jgi:hypothetical protein
MTTTVDRSHAAGPQVAASKPLTGKARKRELEVAAQNLNFTPVKSACTCCRKSRVKCDKMLPCFRCRRLGLECNPQLRGRGRPPVNRSKKAAAEAKAAAAAAAVAANNQARRTSISSLSSTASPTSSSDAHALSHAHKKQRTSFMLNMPGSPLQMTGAGAAGAAGGAPFWPQAQQVNGGGAHILQHGKNRPSLSFNDALFATSSYFNNHANNNSAGASQAQALTAVPPTPFCVAVRCAVVRFFEKQLISPQPQPEQHPYARRYLQMLWHVANKEQCSYLDNLVTYVASHVGVVLDTSSSANSDTSALDVSAAVKNIPRERHMRVAWDTTDAAYWERTIFYGHSSSHTNDKWNKLIYSATDGAAVAQANQGDLLSLIVHADDLTKLCDGIVDAHAGRSDDGCTATNVARVRVFNGLAYDLGVISTSLFVSADGRLAHFCVRVKLADQPTFHSMNAPGASQQQQHHQQQQQPQQQHQQHQHQRLQPQAHHAPQGKARGPTALDGGISDHDLAAAAAMAGGSSTTAAFDNANGHLDPALRRLSFAPFNTLDSRRLSMSSQFSFSDLLADRRNSFVDLMDRRQSWSFPPLMGGAPTTAAAVAAANQHASTMAGAPSVPTTSMSMAGAHAMPNAAGGVSGPTGGASGSGGPSVSGGASGSAGQQTLSSLSSMGLDTMASVKPNPFALRS